MTWLLRLAALVAALLLLRGLWLWFWRVGWKRLLGYTLERARPPGAPPRTGTFKRDPVCGTHVALELSLQETMDGEVFYFCSQRCRELYRVRRARQVRTTG
ncbi:MAG: hypothetical protein ACE5G6_07965 [Terriglobia bacterium]